MPEPQPTNDYPTPKQIDDVFAAWKNGTLLQHLKDPAPQPNEDSSSEKKD